MPIIKIGRRTIAGIPTPERPVIWYDEALKGFGLLVRPTGSRSWIIEYRPGAGGRGVAKRRIVLGDPETMTPEQARAAAKEMLAGVHLGADPAAARAEAAGRASLSAQIGAEAAMAAPLGWRDRADGGTSWHLADPAVRWFLAAPGRE